jgi:hypothetical protein
MLMGLVYNLYIYLFFFNLSDPNFISSKFLPHLLKFRIALNLFSIIRKLNFILLLCFFKHVPPIFLFKFILYFSDIFIGVIKDIDRLNRRKHTSAFIFCISTSSSLVFTSFSLVYPLSIIFVMSFLAFRRGINYFLFPVCL